MNKEEMLEIKIEALAVSVLGIVKVLKLNINENKTIYSILSAIIHDDENNLKDFMYKLNKVKEDLNECSGNMQ